MSRSTHPDEFPGTVVAFGSMGVVTRLALQLVPEFDATQTVRLPAQPSTPCANANDRSRSTAAIRRGRAPRKPGRAHHAAVRGLRPWPTRAQTTDALIVGFDELLHSGDSFSVLLDWCACAPPRGVRPSDGASRPGDYGGMVVTRHFAPPGDAVLPAPRPPVAGLPPAELGLLPPLLGADVPMRATHTAASTDILFWYLSDARVRAALCGSFARPNCVVAAVRTATTR